MDGKVSSHVLLSRMGEYTNGRVKGSVGTTLDLEISPILKGSQSSFKGSQSRGNNHLYQGDRRELP